MLNIEATLNGEDFSAVKIPKAQYSYNELKDRLKSAFTLGINEEIEIYDEDENEIRNTPIIENERKKLHIAIINKHYETADSRSTNRSNRNEESKPSKGEVKDNIGKNKYN